MGLKSVVFSKFQKYGKGKGRGYVVYEFRCTGIIIRLGICEKVGKKCWIFGLRRTVG